MYGLYLDTNILIYLLEEYETYSRLVADKLQEFGADDSLVTSTVTITEFLAGTVSSSFATLQQVPRLHFVPLDEALAEQAALLQRKDGLRIGDAIHLATAVQQEAKSLFTNDKQLAKVAGKYMKVESLPSPE